MTTNEYFSGPEDVRKRELVWGVVREPPAPFFRHQRVSTRLTALLDAHVREHELGTVLAAPMDVVLDDEKALVVQPDVMFISRAREAIIRDFIQGAPDLVIEVVSPGTEWYDRSTKQEWYATYGVCEYWVVDPERQEVMVRTFGAQDEAARTFGRSEPLRSAVLPRFAHTVAEVLAKE